MVACAHLERWSRFQYCLRSWPRGLFVGCGFKSCVACVRNSVRPPTPNKVWFKNNYLCVDWVVVPTVGQLEQPVRLRSSRALALRSRLGMQLFGVAMLLAPAGCYEVGAGADALQCRPGQQNCVCDVAQQCSAGLECRLDRCVDPMAQGTSSGTNPDSGTEQGPKETTGSSPDAGSGTSTSSMPTDQEPNAQCDDGLQNGKETDLDCGGGQCLGCVVGQQCLVASDCRSNQCDAGVCRGQDPECLTDAECKDSNSCTVDRCVASSCQYEDAPEGSSCDDQSACTVGDTCQQGACKGNSAILLDENFDGGKGTSSWSFEHYAEASSRRSTWEIGRAKASLCGADGGFGEDPAQDHSERHRNRVMGSDVGGCHNHGFSPAWDCAWSPYLDASVLEDDVEFSFWRHLHAPGWDTGTGKPTGVRHKVAVRLRGNHGEEVLDLMDGAFGYNDSDWTRQSYRFKRPPKGGPQEVSVGICYQRSGKIDRFAGWSVDDVLVRQQGCKEGL